MEHGGNRPGKAAIGVMVAIGIIVPLLVMLAVVSGFQIPLPPVSKAAAGSPRVETPTATNNPGSPNLTLDFAAQDKTSPWALVSDGKSNPTISVRAGITIQVTFKNTGQAQHTWTLDANSPSPYDVSTAILNPGKSETISFIADKPGEFTYYCEVPGHRELGMKGTIIVEA